MKYFLDTEFIESGPWQPIHLLSIGLVAEDGRTLYYINADAPLADANDWVKANVFPNLNLNRPGYPIETQRLELIRDRVRLFCEGWDSTVITRPPHDPPDHDPFIQGPPEFWGYYADYDWVVFCQMFGTMVDLPKGWPMYCRDLKQTADELGGVQLPKQKTTEHNALNDARWNHEAYLFLKGRNHERNGAIHF